MAGMSGLVGRISVQATGIILAQMIPIVVSPILTRLYTPAEFGLFAIFYLLNTLLIIPVTGQYHLAIILARSDEEAYNLAGATTGIAIIFCCVLGATLIALTTMTVPLGAFADHEGWLVLLPIAVLFLALFMTQLQINIRCNALRRMLVARLTMAGSTAALMIALYPLSIGGLVLATVLGPLFGVLVQVRPLKTNLMRQLSSLRWPRMRAALSEHWRFPLFSMPASLINGLGHRLPQLAFLPAFGSTPTGLLNMSYRVVGTPAAFLGKAFGEIYYKHVADELRETGSCRAAFWMALWILLAVGMPVFAALAWFGPELFAFVFGDEWRNVGTFTRLLIPMYFLRFVVSPISRILYVTRHQDYNLYWQIAFLAGMSLAVALGLRTGSPESTLIFVSAIGTVLYVAYALLCLFAAVRPRPEAPARPV